MELLLKVYVNPSPFVEVVVKHHIEQQLSIKPIFVFVLDTLHRSCLARVPQPISRWNLQCREADSCRLLRPKEVMAVMNVHRHSDDLSSRRAMKGRKQPKLAKMLV